MPDNNFSPPLKKELPDDVLNEAEDKAPEDPKDKDLPKPPAKWELREGDKTEVLDTEGHRNRLNHY